jgi:hypothetical protein
MNPILEIRDVQIAHHISMAKLPWMKHYAWRKCKEIALLHPQEFADLPELVAQAAIAQAASTGQKPALPDLATALITRDTTISHRGITAPFGG